MRLHDHQDRIDALDHPHRLAHHEAIELRARHVHARRVHEDDLAGGWPGHAARIVQGCGRGAVPHAHDAVARGLRLGRHDGELFAHDGVEESGLAHIGPSQNSDGPGHTKRAVPRGFRFVRWV